MFDIDISLDGDRVRARAFGAEGQRPASHEIGSLETLTAFATRVWTATENNVPLDGLLLKQAHALYEALFRGDLRDAFMHARERSNGILLVRLLVEDPQLQCIPWEALCKPGTGAGFLAAGLDFHVARGVASTSVIAPRIVEERLRVLLIAPNEEIAPLQALQYAVGESPKMEWLEPLVGPRITPDRLLKRLQASPRPHLIHFMGHGGLEQKKHPVLRLSDDEDGDEVWIKAESMAQELALDPQGAPLLVILETCEGATAGIFGSAAEQFIRAGVEAVVSYLQPGRAGTLHAASKSFYQALIGDKPTQGDILASVNAARRTLLAHGAAGFSLVAHLRSASTKLFEFVSSKTQAAFSPDVRDVLPGLSTPFARSKVSRNIPAGTLRNAYTTLPNYENIPFVGRTDEHKSLTEAFADDNLAVFVLHGEPGVGKTRLAVEYAMANLDRYPGGVYFVRMDHLPPTDLVEVLRLLGAPKYEGEPLEEQCRRAVRTVGTLGADLSLLLFDAVISEKDLDAWLPPGGARCHVLATSTNRYWTRRHGTCPVPLLPDEDARALATALLGGADVAHGYVEPLIQGAKGLPVELCPNAAAVARAVAHGRAPDLDVMAQETKDSFRTAWNLLSEDARRLLRVTALFEGSRAPEKDLRGLLNGEGWPGVRFEEACDDALDRGMLVRVGEALRMHDLLRRFVFGQAEPRLSDSVLQRFGNLAEEATRAAFEQPTDAVLASRLRSYPGSTSWDRFAELVGHTAGKVAYANAESLFAAGRWDDARVWYERGIVAYKKCDLDGTVDHREIGRGHWYVGKCLSNAGRFDEARSWYERAVAAHEKGDAQGRIDYHQIGRSLHQIGFCLRSTGHFVEAKQWYERAIAAYETGDDHGNVDDASLGVSLHEVGYCIFTMGRFDEARSWYEQAIAAHEKGDVIARVDHVQLGRSLHQVGRCISSAGRFDEARSWYERAVAAHEKGDVYGRINPMELGVSLHEVGRCLSDKGRFVDARHWYERAIAVYEKGDAYGRIDYDQMGRSLHQVGRCLSRSGKFDEARSWYERAVAAKEKGDIYGRINHAEIGVSLHEVGRCFSSAGHFDEARSWYERAIAAKEKGDVYGRINHTDVGVSLTEMGSCLLSTGHFDEARSWYERAIAAKEKGDIYGRINHTGVGVSLHEVGRCFSSTGHFDEARPWYVRAIAAHEKGDIYGRVNHTGLGVSLHDVGFCLSSMHQFDEARLWHERSIAAHEKGDFEGRVNQVELGKALWHLGKCLLSMGRFDEARPWYERAAAAHEKGDHHGRINHTELGVSLHEVGHCISNMGRFEEARTWYERAVAAHEKGDVHRRVNHTELGVSLHEVGRSIASTGRFEEARTWYERAAAAHEKGDVHGRVNYEHIGKSLHQIGYCLSSMDRFEEARAWYERAAAAYEKADVNGRFANKELGICLHQVGFCLSRLGQFVEARTWFERAISIHEKGDAKGRVDHFEIGKAMWHIGKCLSTTRQFAEARLWYERAVAAHEKGDLQGRVSHDERAISLHQVGYCLLNMGLVDEARSWYERAVEAYENGHTLGRTRYAELGVSLREVGFCLTRLSRFHEARPWYERAIAVHEKGHASGPANPKELGKSLLQLGQCLRHLGQLVEAQAALDRAIAVLSGAEPVDRVLLGSVQREHAAIVEDMQAFQPCPCGNGARFLDCHGKLDG